MAEQYANGAETTLSADITNVATSLTLVSATGFPAAPFRIRLDDELIYVGARAGTSCTSLTRGIEGTTGVAHTAGAPITCVLTELGLRNLELAITNAGSLELILATRRGSDTENRFRINDIGYIDWGVGGATAPDTRLRRNSAGLVAVEDAAGTGPAGVIIIPTAGQVGEFTAYNSGEGFLRSRLRGDDGESSVAFGPGTSAADVFLRRSGTKILTFDADGAGGALTAIAHGGALLRGYSGGSFPASPNTNDRFWRTDLGMEFVYDGTRWKCICPHVVPFSMTTTTTLPLTATATSRWAVALPVARGLDILIENIDAWVFVASGGTALGASHKWVATITNRPTAATISTLNLDSGASNSHRNINDTTDIVVDDTAAEVVLILTWTKTGTPGDLQAQVQVEFRYIGV